jgi:signal transduction protein with GAF and PtsI domain
MFNQDRQVLGVLQRRQEQQGNYNSGKLTQLATAATTMAAIRAKFAATKVFPNYKRIKLN